MSELSGILSLFFIVAAFLTSCNADHAAAAITAPVALVLSRNSFKQKRPRRATGGASLLA